MSASDNHLRMELPDQPTLSLLGAIDIAWSQLDTTVAGALATIAGGDPITTFVVIGQMETIPKLSRLQTALLLKGRHTEAALVADVRKALDPHRKLRNGVTHGYYIGKTAAGEICYSLLTQFLTDDPNKPATALVVATIQDLSDHLKHVMAAHQRLMDNFDVSALRSIFDLPGRVRSKG